MKKTLQTQLFENFVSLNKEATQAYKEIKTNMQKQERPFSTIPERKRKHFGQAETDFDNAKKKHDMNRKKIEGQNADLRSRVRESLNPNK